MKNHLFFCLFLFSLFLTGCAGKNEKLVVGLVPYQTPAELLEKFEPMHDYLERETGTTIEVFIPDDYGELIEAMKNDQVDIGQYGPLSFTIAERQKDLIPLVVRDRKDYGITYNSIIITKKGAGYASIDDLKGVTMAFVNPASTSGFIMPYSLFKSRGIDIDMFFSDIKYLGSHDKVLEAIVGGEIDAGAMSKTVLTMLIQDGEAGLEDLDILWESEPIPGSPWVSRADFSQKQTKAFVDAMLSIHEKDPEALAEYGSSKIRRYVRIDDEMYNGVRNIVNILGEEFVIKNYLGN